MTQHFLLKILGIEGRLSYILASTKIIANKMSQPLVKIQSISYNLLRWVMRDISRLNSWRKWIC